MCGIVGITGAVSVHERLVEGLAQLEYRGYDSAGIACIDSTYTRLEVIKAEGAVEGISQNPHFADIKAFTGIAHTRWATHGHASVVNAHPHTDCQGTLALAHNGIFENYYELKQRLHTSHTILSSTDTEIVAHLFEEILACTDNLYRAALQLVGVLQGAFACAIVNVHYPNTILAIRKQAPLCVGRSNKYAYVASDPAAFTLPVQEVLFMPEGSFALVEANKVQLYDFSGASLPVTYVAWNEEIQEHHKGEYPHFMLKEIYEQPRAMSATVKELRNYNNIIETLGVSLSQLQKIDHIELIGCGTSFLAGSLGQIFFEQLVGVPTRVHIASELRHMPVTAGSHTLTIAISQSGETADTLEAMRNFQKESKQVIALTNERNSTIVREAPGHLLTQAGKEISVASTKAFTTQVTSLYWLAQLIAQIQTDCSSHQMEEHMNTVCMQLSTIASLLDATMAAYAREIKMRVQAHYYTYSQFLFLGRHVGYPLALEGALKLKEISYIFCQAYPAGELKHGPLALIDAHMPVVLISHSDPAIYQKIVSNAQEIKARHAHVIVLAFEGQDELIALADWALVFPYVDPLLAPLVMTGALQLFAYEMACALGRPVDKPRNLAKSVTVE
jgi:glucosamine--fructose-6-phosphate aminotransferase (isomerizing)